MHSPEDKQFWVQHGADAEFRFAGPVFTSGCAVVANPAKLHDPYSHDFFMMVPADLKTIRTPFRTADRYGIPSEFAITLNRKDVERYEQYYPHIILIFDIDYPNFRSIRYAPLRDICKAIRMGMAKLHAYQNRVDDREGNAKDSYVLDARWFVELGKTI